jgi:CheY-like chemotaxis protein
LDRSFEWQTDSLLYFSGQPVERFAHRNSRFGNPGDFAIHRATGIGYRMETILLVDDNPLRASVRKSLLEGNAPAVVRVLDAGEALCLVESPEFARDLALVITGHVMTGIPGPEFVAEFRSRMARVPVLVLSAVPNAEREYQDISGVTVSQTMSSEELRSLVSRLIHSAANLGQRQTA